MLLGCCKSRLSLRLLRNPPHSQRSIFPIHGSRHVHQSGTAFNTSSNEPLRILFCGSDRYSIVCLEALNSVSISQPDLVRSIDVACRPGKPVGRGYKEIRHPPIREVASRLGLQIHEIDTFTGWNLPSFPDPPNSINLIVAVSFGLFVPPRILRAAKYGGINVHPSRLPDLRGAAPLHWALIANDKTTAVTVQTLHHEKFDHGAILGQTPRPGLPIPSNAKHDDLLEIVMPESAKLLLDVIRNRRFEAKTPSKEQSIDGAETRIAPKIQSLHRRVDWQNWSANDICRRIAVLGRVWTVFTPHHADPQSGKVKPVRIILGEESMALKDSRESASYTVLPEVPVGVPYAVMTNASTVAEGHAEHLLVNMSGGTTLVIPKILVEGSIKRPAVPGAIFHRLVETRKLDDRSSLLVFHGRLE